MKTITKHFLKGVLFASFILIGISASAQNSRAYIRDYIKQWGECRNVAITKTNGDIALYGKNGYAYSQIPNGLSEVIKRLNKEEETIQDIQLTDAGRWLILYGDNGMEWYGIPDDLEETIRKYHGQKEKFNTVTFNDDGDWVVVTTEHISASDDAILEWLKEGLDEYGALWTACVTDDGLVVVYERGYQFLGNVPNDLKQALRESNLNVFRLKISGDAWFFADKNGTYRYNM